jgi:hypothetical protein
MADQTDTLYSIGRDVDGTSRCALCGIAWSWAQSSASGWTCCHDCWDSLFAPSDEYFRRVTLEFRRVASFADVVELESKLATLTSILCTEEGQDVVERAKALVETELAARRLAEDRRTMKRHVLAHEDLEHLIGAAKRSGYVAAVGALHNAMPPGFVEPDADKVIGRVVAALAEKDTIEASLRSRVELLTQKLTDCEGALDQYRALATTADNLEQENARLREHIRTARKS